MQLSAMNRSISHESQPLKFGKYFHIYNCGINGCNLFNEEENYHYFLHLYDKYTSPIVDTYAWVLMPNHFHLLVRIKNEEDVRDYFSNQTGYESLSGLKIKPLHQYFSNLFNAYTKAYNKHFHRHGALFERPFKRKLIDNQSYLKNALVYIHNNPVHHGFTDKPSDYSWSSYLSCVSIKSTKLKREQVMGWFDNEANFKTYHDKKLDIVALEKWLEL